MEDKERIVQHAREVFLKTGFYKTSMDELARELSMSKKTIYKYYSSKENLVEAVFEELMSDISKKMDGILTEDKSAISKIIAMLGLISTLSVTLGDKWISDMKHHTPHLWKRIESFRIKKMNSNFKLVIEQGKKEKYFEDKPIDIILPIFISAVSTVVTPDFLLNHNYSFKEAVEITFDILLNGILTEKGSKQLYNLKNRTDQ